jgi:ribosomal protein RSM22 (predicted rRNA methylase)
MKLPGSVQAVIDEETAAIPASSLREAAAQLGCAYRMAAQSPLRIDSPAQYLAYAVARMPAIFEVNLAAALELRRLRPALEIRSMLDLGCGPGTATIALRQAFETLEAATCADRDLQWLKLAKRLISAADPRLAAASRFTVFDLHGTARLDQHDLVVMS